MGNEVVKKDILAQYVHDAVDIEVRRHTLNRTRDDLILLRDKRLQEQEDSMAWLNNRHEQETEEIERELGSIEAKHTSKVSSIEERIKKNKDEIDEVKKIPSKVWNKFHVDVGPILGFGLLGLIVVLCFN